MEEKNISLQYRITKINTTNFHSEDITILEIDDLIEKDNLLINIGVSLKVDDKQNDVSIIIHSLLSNKISGEELIKHSAKTVFLVKGLELLVTDENGIGIPENYLTQWMAISFSHARALLSNELSPTSYKEKFFLPIVAPKKLVNLIFEQ